MSIKISGRIVEGKFKARLTRFSVCVQLDEKTEVCFLPNPGRLEELLVPGVTVIVKEMVKSGRKTSYDIIGVCHSGQIVSVDSRLPNELVFEALRNGKLPEFVGYSVIRREPVYNHTRFDFLLAENDIKCFLEVKSCTLVRNGVAMFPDAPTKRGTKHMIELIKAKGEGYRASVLFIIQRVDAKIFMPNDKMDPAFGTALRHASKRGVEVYAYSSRFFGNILMLGEKINVVL